MAIDSVSEVFEKNIAGRLESKPELAAQIGASYKFEVTGDGGGTWVVDLKEGNGSVSAGDGDADCHITVESADFLALTGLPPAETSPSGASGSFSSSSNSMSNILLCFILTS